MIQRLTQAKRLVEAFIALMVGRKARVHWDDRGSMDSAGGIHLPAPKSGDAAEIALLTRLAVHEGGHLLETEQGFADRLTKEELTIFNCLEDPRMENRQVRRFPGASLVLSRGLDEMLQRIEDNLDETLRATPARAVQLDRLMRGFLAVAPHGPIARRAPAILQRLAPHIEEAQRTAIDETVARLPALSTSLEAEDAARNFLARLRELETPPPQQGDPEQQQSEPDEPQQDRQDQQDQAAADGGGEGDAQQQPSREQEQGNADSQQPEGSDEEGGQGQAEQPGEASEGAGNSGEQPSETQPSAGSDPANGEPSDTQGAGQSEPEAAQPPGSQNGQAGGGQQSATGSDPNEAAAAGGADDAQPKEGSGPGSSEPSASSASAGQAGDQNAQGGAQPDPAADGFDLGQLLREAHVARYGAPDTTQATAGAEEGAAELGDEELQRVAALLAQADPSCPLEELVEASLVALAAGDSNEGGEPAAEGASEGAGMSLASAPAGPVAVLETRLQGVQSRLVTVLQRELQDKRRRPTRAAYGGRVMAQRFWRLGAMGDTKVFVHRQPAAGIDAAATVLLDSSDSMDLQLTVAAEVTMAFSLALQRLGVRTRVARFPGTDTVTETIQRFGESARSCVHRCAELQASGGTPIGAAVALETPALIEQRKLKNVLAVVTDDQPGDKATLVAAIERARELDILVVGVGIGCDIRMWIPNSVSVQTVNELPDALARLFRENITEKLAA